MGMFVRALAYLMSHGADGLRQVSGDAVLNANYVLRRLEDAFSAPFAHAGPAMHEALFDDHALRNSGVTTLDVAKAIIDEGLHPMTIYFPLVVHGAMLVEPTETETRASLDRFIDIMRGLAERAKAGAAFSEAPHHAPAAGSTKPVPRAARCCVGSRPAAVPSPRRKGVGMGISDQPGESDGHDSSDD